MPNAAERAGFMHTVIRTAGRIAPVLTLALFACGGPATAAPVELRVFEWEDYIRPHAADFEAFAKAQGLEVRLTFPIDAQGKEILITSADDIFEAVRNKTVDVITPTHNYYKDSGSKLLRLLAPIDLAQVPNFVDLVGNLKAARYAEEDGRKYAVPLLGGGYSLAYNADRVPAPASWAVLADPAAKGRTSITGSQYEANVYVAAILAGTPPSRIYGWEGIEPAKLAPLLTAMVGNVRAFWDSNPDIALMEKDLDYITDYGFGVAFANAKGQNWKFATPAEPTTVWLDNVSLTPEAVSTPDKSRAAHMLVNFLIGPEVQARIALAYGVVVPNPKAIEHVPADRKDGIRVGSDSFYREELLWQPLDRRTRNGFKGLWDAAVEKAGPRR